MQRFGHLIRAFRYETRKKTTKPLEHTLVSGQVALEEIVDEECHRNCRGHAIPAPMMPFPSRSRWNRETTTLHRGHPAGLVITVCIHFPRIRAYGRRYWHVPNTDGRTRAPAASLILTGICCIHRQGGTGVATARSRCKDGDEEVQTSSSENGQRTPGALVVQRNRLFWAPRNFHESNHLDVLDFAHFRPSSVASRTNRE